VSWCSCACFCLVLFVRVFVCLCLCLCLFLYLCLWLLVCGCASVGLFMPTGVCVMNVVVGVEFHLLKLLFDTLTLSCSAMFAWLLAQTVLTSEDAVVCVFGFCLLFFSVIV